MSGKTELKITMENFSAFMQSQSAEMHWNAEGDLVALHNSNGFDTSRPEKSGFIAGVGEVSTTHNSDALRERLEELRKWNDMAVDDPNRLSHLLTATFIREMRGEGFGRSKPAKRAMAKLAARRGRRG